MRAGGQTIAEIRALREEQAQQLRAQAERRAEQLRIEGDQAVNATEHQVSRLQQELDQLKKEQAELPKREETEQLQLDAERERVAGGRRQLEALRERFSKLIKQATDTSDLLRQIKQRYVNDAIAWRIEELQAQLDAIKASAEEAMFRFFASAANFASTVADSNNRVGPASPRQVRQARAQPSHGQVENLVQQQVSDKNEIAQVKTGIPAQEGELGSQERQLNLAADRQASQIKLAAADMARRIDQAEKNKALLETRKGEIRQEADRAAAAATENIG